MRCVDADPDVHTDEYAHEYPDHYANVDEYTY
jgi:hypothetical protein